MRKRISKVLALIWAIYQIFIVIRPDLLILTGQRAIHLGFGLMLLWFMRPINNKQKNVSRTLQLVDTVLMGIITVGIITYMVLNAERFEFYQWGYTFIDKVVAIVGIILVLEATRRILGKSLVLISGVFMLYGIIGNYIPGSFGHRGNTIPDLATKLFLTFDGVFGAVIGVSASIIFIFLLFGGFLNVMGGGKFFTDLSLALFGGARGGPAKMAVVSSCFFGSISGSAIANVVTTGTITIPLMKDLGYRPAFAAAVEAVASTGGQYMPPVMGATAFIMANMMGVEYPVVVKAAFISAILYYLALLLMVDFEAGKSGMKGLDKSVLPKASMVMKEGWHFLIPFAVMLYLLLYLGFEAQRAGLYSILTMVFVEIMKRPKAETLKKVIDSLIEGAMSALAVAIPCACIGLVVGVVLITGVGLEFSSLMRSLSGGNLFPLLIIMMITSLILGLGVPTTAAYILVSVLAVPTMIELGVPMMAAHLFCFYFAVISVITPPVALAAYTAAGIAKSDPNETGWIALRLGIAGFIVPFVFVYQPGLLLMGPINEIIYSILNCTVGIVAIASGLQGYLFGALNKATSALMLLISILLIFPNVWMTIAGYIGFAIVLGFRIRYIFIVKNLDMQ